MAALEELKRAAGYRASEFVRDGMVIGLGSGSTARYATLRIARRLCEGSLRDIIAIPTSEDTARLARDHGIPLSTLDTYGEIEVTIDGADEVDPDFNLIKGHGGFLLREKIVASATRHEIIVVDDSKLVERLGSRFPVPVEVVRFGWRQVERVLSRIALQVALRLDQGTPRVTDEGNYILDCSFESIDDPKALSRELNSVPGVVENGLFVDMVERVVVAAPAGVRILEK
ncbi:MAG: ribose-5-phosphate isomerase RpiA [Anaerolineae bacterium]|nr:ribose-5-phosphate isomerase RpiA [Anaerolineae bacterium]